MKLEDMTYPDLLGLLYEQFGDNYEASEGYTMYEICRMNLLQELTTLLEEHRHNSDHIRKRCLYLARLEQLCLSIDMAEPLEPKMCVNGNNLRCR